MKHLILTVAAIIFATILLPGRAGAQPDCKGACSCGYAGCRQSWNGQYYNVEWGMPVALVVPPTAEVQTHWGWGVGNTRVTPICSQYRPNYPGPGVYHRGMFRPTPPWPSDTDQFGFYYVRGPW